MTAFGRRGATSAAAAVALLGGLLVASADRADAAKGKGGLTAKERRAIDLTSVQVLGEESLGILVRAEFAGNITKVIGRGRLRKVKADLLLSPDSPGLAPARLVTKSAGIIGRTVAQTSSEDVGVVRDGRSLTFFNFGPGFSGVATAEVRVLGLGGKAQAVASGDTVGDGSGPVAVPKADLTCAQLTDALSKVEEALKTAQAAKAKTESLLKGVEKLLKDLDKGSVLNKAHSLIEKLENLYYGVKQTTTEEAVANLKKSKDDIEKQLKQVNATIDDLEAQRQKLKDKLGKCSAPPPCTGSLERSSGTPPYTAANHIRVRATCPSAIKKVIVKSLSGDTFDACAQTAGTGTGCVQDGDTLTSTWNQPAGQQLEFYGRVTANADGNYEVTVYGDGDVVLHTFQATVPP